MTGSNRAIFSDFELCKISFYAIRYQIIALCKEGYFCIIKTVDMIQKKLQISVFARAKGTANVVFKSDGLEFRIAGLLEGMRLVGCLEQLRLAMNAGGGTESWFELEDVQGDTWLLEVWYLNGVVAINLWAKYEGDGTFTAFSWDGSVGEFDLAVRRLVSFEKVQ